MYSFLIPPSPGTVDKNPVSHTVHNSVRKKGDAKTSPVKRKSKEALDAARKPR